MCKTENQNKKDYTVHFISILRTDQIKNSSHSNQCCYMKSSINKYRCSPTWRVKLAPLSKLNPPPFLWKNGFLTFSPAGQHVAQVDDPVGRVVVGDVGGLPLPKAHLVLHPLARRLPLLLPLLALLAVRATAPADGKKLLYTRKAE